VYKRQDPGLRAGASDRKATVASGPARRPGSVGAATTSSSSSDGALPSWNRSEPGASVSSDGAGSLERPFDDRAVALDALGANA